MKIIAVALKNGMLADPQQDVEIAGRPALGPGFAFAAEP